MTDLERTNRKSKTALSAVLHYLDTAKDISTHIWKDWVIQPLTGGVNNRLFRVTGELGDLVVKYTIRDERDRAGREYAALNALHQAGGTLVPRAVWLDRHSFKLPVVVQTWLEGETLTSPPQSQMDWQALVDH